MRIESSAFQDGAPIPKKFTQDGENISPPLAWSDAPPRTVSFALVMDDPDAPRAEPWVHWLLYGIPGQVTSLAENVPREELLSNPDGALQGTNSWGPGNIGYRGPSPPPGHGPHRYQFRIYALDARLDLEAGLRKEALLKAIAAHTLSEALVIGTYERPGRERSATF
jgi:Raf kinase inhibitor-like YbhB/YbcL family protein